MRNYNKLAISAALALTLASGSALASDFSSSFSGMIGVETQPTTFDGLEKEEIIQKICSYKCYGEVRNGLKFREFLGGQMHKKLTLDKALQINAVGSNRDVSYSFPTNFPFQKERPSVTNILVDKGMIWSYDHANYNNGCLIPSENTKVVADDMISCLYDEIKDKINKKLKSQNKEIVYTNHNNPTIVKKLKPSNSLSLISDGKILGFIKKLDEGKFTYDDLDELDKVVNVSGITDTTKGRKTPTGIGGPSASVSVSPATLWANFRSYLNQMNLEGKKLDAGLVRQVVNKATSLNQNVRFIDQTSYSLIPTKNPKIHYIIYDGSDKITKI